MGLASTRAGRSWAALALAVIFLLPLAGAGYKTFGDSVDGGATDKDITHLLMVAAAVAPGAEVRFVDGDASTTVSTSEAVFIDSDGSGTVTALDVRVRSGSLTKGAFVRSADTDCCGTPLVAVPGGDWGFVDIYPTGALDGELNLGEPVFLDLDNSGTVTTSDIKITTKSTTVTNGVATSSGTGSFANVAGSDTEINDALITIAGYALNGFDANGNGVFDFADTLYLDVDADQLPGPGDVRISKPTTGSSLAAGSMPKAGDADTVHELAALAGAALAFHDADVSTTVGSTEAIYIDADNSGTVTARDVRLQAAGGTTLSGAQVLAADSDVTNPLTAIPGNGFMFNDRNGNTLFDAADALYIEMDGDAVVEVGDLRVAKGTATISLGRVTGSPADINAPLVAVATGFSYFDFNGGGAYTFQDAIYLDSDADGLVSPRDVRLSLGTTPLTPAGDIVLDTDSEVEFCFDFAFGGGALAYVEESGPGTVNVDEPVYFDRAGDLFVSTNDVRIFPPSGIGTAGSFVKASDNDNANVMLALPGGTFAWHDSNGDGLYSTKGTGTQNDAVYYDMDSSGTVTAGDVRITKAALGTGTAGSKVFGAAGDLNSQLTAFVGEVIRGIDSDGDGTFTLDDALYLNIDVVGDTALVAAGCVTPADIRLSGTGGSSGGGGGGGGGGGSTTTQTTSSSSTSSSDTSSSSSSTDTSSSSTSTQTDAPSDLATANLGIRSSLTVIRDGTSNTLAWSEQPGVDGYQVFASSSPFVLLTTLIGQATNTFTHADGDEDTVYLVTAYNDGAELTADQVNNGQVPGYTGVPAGEAPEADDDGKGGDKGFIPAPSFVVVVALLAGLVLALRRKV